MLKNLKSRVGINRQQRFHHYSTPSLTSAPNAFSNPAISHILSYSLSLTCSSVAVRRLCTLQALLTQTITSRRTTHLFIQVSYLPNHFHHIINKFLVIQFFRFVQLLFTQCWRLVLLLAIQLAQRFCAFMFMDSLRT